MYRLKQLTLFLGDWLMLYIGLYLAILVRFFSTEIEHLVALLLPMTLLFFVATIIFFIFGLYDLNQTKNNKSFFKKITVSAVLWLILGVAFFYINVSSAVTPKTILLLTMVFGFSLVALWRFTYNYYIATNVWQINVVFAGFLPEVQELINIFNKEPQQGYIVRAIIAQQPVCNISNKIIVTQNIKEIKEKLKNQGQTIIILTPEMQSNNELLKELYQSLFEEMSIMSIVEFYENITGRIPPFTFSESWFISNLQEQNKKIYDRFKLLIDIVFAIILGFIFLITFPFILLATKLNSRGPIFFKQKRTGKGGGEFILYKYRTMKALSGDGSAETDGPQFSSHQDARITGVGKILRKTRMDELPQFYNILRRQMSIIGPRPERPELVQQLLQTMPYYALRHIIKPGITGWAQVKHGYTENMDETLKKLEYDLHYIKNRGPLLDISIILRTVNIVLKLAGK